jgi:hypothetical protein
MNDTTLDLTANIIDERGVVKIRDDNKGTYTLCGCEKPSLCMCVRWVHQYRDQIQKNSVYINDPNAAAGYAANVAKAEKEKADKEKADKAKADKAKAASQCHTPFVRRQYSQPLPPPSPVPLRTSLSLPLLPPLLSSTPQQPIPMSPQLLLFAQQNPTPPHIRPIPKF